MSIQPTIQLTAREQELFDLLLEVVTHYNRKTVLRVAGGWVRDKLLQKQSHDIDIALDDVSGIEFANLVNEFLTHRGMETRTIALIQANPDQSKHLETANVKILGVEIDFVHLRSETYTDTRIPEIQKGTAEEDARRRDFTINALFYNLNERTVEDLTGFGLQDLHNRIIRTPIDPLVTFNDDPLRILRAVRFASRLLFDMDPSIQLAARDAAIQRSLRGKVSRERVYKECEGMTTHAQARPCLSFLMMHRLNILEAVLPLEPAALPLAPKSADQLAEWQTILGLSDAPDPWSSWRPQGLRAVLWLNVLFHLRTAPALAVLSAELQSQPLSFHPALAANPLAAKHLCWAAAVFRLWGVAVTEKKKETALVLVLLRDGLKMENNGLKSVTTLLEAARTFAAIGTAAEVTLDNAGAALRAARELWRDGLLLAAASQLAVLESFKAEPGLLRESGPYFDQLTLDDRMRAVIERFAAMERRIEQLGLDGVWNLRPLLDGAQLIARLQLQTKGPLVGRLVEEQICWQIRNGVVETSEQTIELLLAHLRQFL